MTQLLEVTNRRSEFDTAEDFSEGGGTATLTEQGSAWAIVAREAREACDREDDAVQELQRRQNTSGE